MKRYWDTSAIINGFVSEAVFSKLDDGENVTRSHAFSEFFATMTGREIPSTQGGQQIRVRMSPGDCAVWLRTFSAKVGIVNLTREEVLAALDKAQKANVQGGRVYDYLHAKACEKAESDVLLTRNLADFTEFFPNVQQP
jgi:hypothetical protein